MKARLIGAALVIALALPGRAAEPLSGTWTHGAPAPHEVAEIGVAALRGKIYTVGGTEQIGSGAIRWDSQQVLVYDPAARAWSQAPQLPRGLSHAGVTSLGDKLYAIGGFTSPVHMGPQSLAFVFDPSSSSWAQLPDLPTARGSVAVAAVNGKLHVFGGRVSSQVVKISPPGAPDMFAAFGTVNTHDVYDPVTRRWTTASPIPGPARDHMGVAVLDGKIHLFGGRVSDVTDNLARHDVYDPVSDRWTSAAPLPRPRSSGAFTVLGGHIIYAGGECKPGGQPYTPNAYDDVTAYDAKTDRWSSLTPLPEARHAFGAATVGDRAYFIGGAPVCGGGATSDLLILTLP